MEQHERSTSLVDELDALNVSGGLGGDLLNKVCISENDLVNVMNIPSTEGHVFRSKERTPVLLLIETICDESMLSNNEEVKYSEESGTSVQEVDGKGEDDRDTEEANGSIETLPDGEDQIGNSENVNNSLREEVQTLNIDDSKSGDEGVIMESNSSFISCQSEDSKGESATDAHGTNSVAKTEGGNKSCGSAEMCDVKFDLATENCDSSVDGNTDVTEGNVSSPIHEYNEENLKEIKISASQQPATIDEQLQQSKAKRIFKETSDLLTRRKESLGSLSSSVKAFSQHPFDLLSNLSANGEGRRQVLTSIFLTGMRSSNMIARGVAPVAQKVVQAMDRKRATRLLNGNDGKKQSSSENKFDSDVLPEQFRIFPHGESDEEDSINSHQPSEEDECMESLRLLLIQNGVALGKLTPEKAARKLAMSRKDHQKEKGDSDDAGNIDPRLGGCGVVSDAVSSAIELWKNGTINNGELLDLVKKDLEFTRLALPGAENENKLIEDSDFWGRFAFGERWAEKKARIQSSSPFGSRPGWDLTGVIVKSNDDLRQEAFTMQLIELCGQAFDMAGLELWLQPYRILATGRTTGVIEMVRNAMSFDSLKKRPGYQEGGLLGHFKKMSECTVDPDDALKSAKKNFVRSLAAYSLLSYLFLFKDRHNGNILLDTAGHVIHIDFGFIFGIAPGGSFSLEQAVPFKITDEMVEVMGGLKSPLFSEFVTLFCCGFLALQAQTETFVTIVEITSLGSTFNCFEGKDRNEVVTKLRERFCHNLEREETIAHAMELIKQATTSYGTKQYDYFQYLSQGIAA
jgi:phosphatidylinositol 4-kinase